MVHPSPISISFSFTLHKLSFSFFASVISLHWTRSFLSSSLYPLLPDASSWNLGGNQSSSLTTYWPPSEKLPPALEARWIWGKSREWLIVGSADNLHCILLYLLVVLTILWWNRDHTEWESSFYFFLSMQRDADFCSNERCGEFSVFDR